MASLPLVKMADWALLPILKMAASLSRFLPDVLPAPLRVRMRLPVRLAKMAFTRTVPFVVVRTRSSHGLLSRRRPAFSPPFALLGVSCACALTRCLSCP